MIEELISIGVKILIIDKSTDRIGAYKGMASSAYIIDVTSPDALKKIVPEHIDGVIVDMGKNLESSVLAVNNLRKMNIGRIVVRAETDEQAEILKIVGATQVVFPDLEAAKRIAPLLAAPTVFHHLPVAGGMTIAEVQVPDRYVGKTLIETNFRQEYRVNIIAVEKNTRKNSSSFRPTIGSRKTISS
jgi:trk system potassium uptake protein TrkA